MLRGGRSARAVIAAGGPLRRSSAHTPLRVRRTIRELGVVGKAAGLLATFSTAACAQEPQELTQVMDITLRGGERNIDARLIYACRDPGPASPYPYVPVANGILFEAKGGQAVFAGATQEGSPDLCTYPGDQWNTPAGAQTPLLMWIDDIGRPGQIDVIDPGTAAKHPKSLTPELARFSLRSLAEGEAAKPMGKVSPVQATYRDIVSSRPGRGAPMAAPARVVASVEFADQAQAAEFASLLGSEVSPGARAVPFCVLARIPGGAEFLRTQRLAGTAGCSGGTMLEGAAIRFSVPLPMKRLRGAHWAASSSDFSASYLGGAGSPEAPARDGRSRSFWADKVETVTWVADDGRRITLPARGPAAFHFTGSSVLLLLLDDVRVAYFRNPKEWVTK